MREAENLLESPPFGHQDFGSDPQGAMAQFRGLDRDRTQTPGGLVHLKKNPHA
jgi:hypothetical protein